MKNPRKNGDYEIVLKRDENMCTISTKTKETYDLWIKYFNFFTIQDNFYELYHSPELICRHDNLSNCYVIERNSKQKLHATIFPQPFLKRYHKQVKHSIMNNRSLTDVR